MKRSASDQADLFLFYWKVYAPDGFLPSAEYEFARVLGRKFRFDWAWIQYRVAVEVDGGGWMPHGGRHGSDKDRAKSNIAASLRWLVFHFSPDMLKRDPAGCIDMVLKAIKDSV